jgi:glycosyltransferase involved in cell wall biosynthesis
MSSISCIIPAYNEETRIGKVLDVVIAQKNIDEIIVIDDGSSDNTKGIVTMYPGVKLIIHSKNEGKSKSISDGIIKASGSHLLFLDADLVGFNQKNLDDLIRPVITQRADMSMSLRGNTPKIWRIINLDYISGERLLPRNAFDQKSIECISKIPHFGLEVFMNEIIIIKKYRIKIVSWPNVNSPYKHSKYGWYHGTKEDVFMLRDIFNTVPLHKLFKQILCMRKSSIK